MIRKLLFFTAVSVLAIQGAYSQTKGVESAKPLKPGELVHLSEDVTFKVTRSPKSSFTDVKLQGQAVVVVLEFDAGKKSATISYELSSNPKLSEIYLSEGTQKIAPRAVMEDFPGWGGDNDKEIEVLDPKEKSGGVNLTFAKKGTVSLLFDIPAEQAKSPQKLSIRIRVVKPTDEQHSFVVSL